MNAFASYGETQSRYAPKPRKEEKPPSELEKKMAEKQRLSRAYRKWKAESARMILQSEPRLRAFASFLRKCSDRDELCEAITDSWLPGSSQPIRIHALRLIDARCNKLNQQAGFDVLDDPFPPETSAYFEAKKLLHKGGMQ